MYKFESAPFPYDKFGNRLKSFNDPDASFEHSVKPFGVFCRKTKIDELANLFNVLKGDMSIVGPRPAMPSEKLSQDTERHTVKPGLTCFTQLLNANETSDDKKLGFDHLYVRTRNGWIDLKIIAKTPSAIIKGFKQPHFDHSNHPP